MEAKRFGDMQKAMDVRIAEEIAKLPDVNIEDLQNDLNDIAYSFKAKPILLDKKELQGLLDKGFDYDPQDVFKEFNDKVLFAQESFVSSGMRTFDEYFREYRDLVIKTTLIPPSTAPTDLLELEQWANVFAKNKIQGKFLHNDKITYFQYPSGMKMRAESWYQLNTIQYITQQSDEDLKVQMAKYGYDLIRVSAHRDCSELCFLFQAAILSMFGRTPGYVTFDEAVSMGFRHTRCRHDIELYDPEYSEDPKEQYKDELVTKKEAAENYAKRQQAKHNYNNFRRYEDRYERAVAIGDDKNAEKFKNLMNRYRR